VEEIRRFKPIDTFRVIKLASMTLTERYDTNLFTYFYETFPQGFIVAEKNHKIIGFLIGIKTTGTKAKIVMFSVDTNFQGKKIGLKLLKEFIKTSIQENIKTIDLAVQTNNIKAINFYEKQGFKKIEKIKEFYQNKEDAYIMRLYLDSIS